MGRESSCISNRTLSRQKEGVSGGNTRGGSKSLLSCITLYTQQKSEANMARLAVALALAAGAQAFMAPVTTQPAKTVVYGKGGELRDRTTSAVSSARAGRYHAPAAPDDGSSSKRCSQALGSASGMHKNGQ